MPLFFFLAGYVYRPKGSSLSDFCVSRARTILWPYVFFTLLSICASFCRKLIGQEITLEQIFGGFIRMGFVESNPPLWFLRSIFVVEILFFLYQKLQKNHPVDFFWVYLILVLEFISGWNFYTRTVNGFVFYALGYTMRNFAVLEKVEKYKIPVCILSAVGFLLAFSNNRYDISIVTHNCVIPFVLITHMGILCIITLSMCFAGGKWNLLEYLGRNSLVILGTHVLIKDVISVCLQIVWKNDSFMDVKSNLNAFATTAVILVISCVSAEIINRYFPFVLGRCKKAPSMQ